MGLLNRQKLDASDRAYIVDNIARATAGEIAGGYRIDVDRLDDDEQVRLGKLIQSASDGGFSTGKFSKSDLRQFEALVEKGLGAPAGSIFEARRAEERDRRASRDHDAAGKRRWFSREEERGFLVAMFDALASPSEELWIDDVACLTLVLSMFAAGRTLNVPGASLEGAGNDLTLRFNIRWGLVAASDGAGALDSLLERLKFLDKEQWLRVDSRGGRWAVQCGPRLLAALGGELFELPQEREEVVIG